MADEPEQSYDSDLFNDVKAAVVENRTPEPAAEPSPTPQAAPAEAAPADPSTRAQDKATDGRPRDEQGRFTEKPADPSTSAQEPKPDEAKQVTATTAAPKVPDVKPIGRAPSGWSPRAVQQWGRLPQEVRDAIEAQADPAYGDLKPFAERAKAQGQRLDQVLQSYVGIEDLIRNNPMQGFSRVAQNIGMTQHQMAQFFGQLAQAHGYTNGQLYSPAVDPNAAQQAEQQPDLSQLLAPVVSPLQQRLDQLEQRYIQQAEAERGQRLQGATSVIEKFRQDPANRYYDNVEAKVGDLLEKGVIPRTGDFHADLAAAYAAACKLDPTVSEILEEERQAARQAEKDKAAREAAEKARSASRSVTGSPSSGASNPAVKRDPRVSYDDDLHNDVVAAMRESMGRA